MKNLIIILIIIGLIWYFYDIGQNNKSIEDAKKELGVIDESSNNIINENQALFDNTENNIVKDSNIDTVIPNYTVTQLDDKNFIKIDDLSQRISNFKDELKITGTVLNSKVDKIVVSFRNVSSDFPNDIYELSKFKVGNESFEYNANSKLFRNIDYGNNEYTIEAYIGSDVSKLELNINVPENLGESLDKSKAKQEILSEEVIYDKKIIGSEDDALYLGMPVSKSFGKPLSIGNGDITYSNISGLVIEKKDISASKLKIENLWKSDSSGYLNTNIDSSYVYWNTYRNIDDSKPESGISFYVLRNDNDEYVYEKYYFDFKHSLKGLLEIERFDVKGDSISVEMSELIDNLKEKNKDYLSVNLADKLFKEIVR